MRSIHTFWREPAFVLGAAAIVAIILYNASFVHAANFEGYWLSTFANASIFLIFSCPAGSASAAIIAARARRSGIWALPLARNRAAVTVRLLLPSFVAGFAAQLFGLLLLATSSWGAPGRIPIEILLAWAAILAFHISVGYLLGRFLPVAASIPLAIFISYCWLGFTWTVDYFPLRYLSGLVIESCCSVDTTLDERSVIAVVSFSLPTAVGLLILATIPPAGAPRSIVPLTSLAATALVAAAAVLGVNVAQGLTGQPVIARGREDLVCTGRAPTVCLYPEEFRGDDPRPALRAAYANLRAEGVPVPAVVTASNTKADRSSLRVVVPPRTTPAQLVHTTAAALIPDDVAPYCGDGSDYSDRLDTASVATWWLQTVAAKGLADESQLPQPDYGPDAPRLIQEFAQLNGKQQLEWYLAATPALRHCSSKPIALPSP